jgi:hypothetical protein
MRDRRCNGMNLPKTFEVLAYTGEVENAARAAGWTVRPFQNLGATLLCAHERRLPAHSSDRPPDRLGAQNIGGSKFSAAQGTNTSSPSTKRFSRMPHKSARIEVFGVDFPFLSIHHAGSEIFPPGCNSKFMIRKVPDRPPSCSTAFRYVTTRSTVGEKPLGRGRPRQGKQRPEEVSI